MHRICTGNPVQARYMALQMGGGWCTGSGKAGTDPVHGSTKGRDNKNVYPCPVQGYGNAKTMHTIFLKYINKYENVTKNVLSYSCARTGFFLIKNPVLAHEWYMRSNHVFCSFDYLLVPNSAISTS